MHFSIVETTYQSMLDPTVDPGPSFSRMEEKDLLPLLAWVVASSCLHDFLDAIFPSNEVVL